MVRMRRKCSICWRRSPATRILRWAATARRRSGATGRFCGSCWSSAGRGLAESESTARPSHVTAMSTPARPVHNYALIDPLEAAAMTARKMLQAIIDGRLPQPPISKTLSFWLAEVGEGFEALEGDTGPHLVNPGGGV